MPNAHVVQQRDTIPIINFDKYVIGGALSRNVTRRHSKLLPDYIRAIVCGPSNCGKTNAVFNLLFAENGLKFGNIYIFSKSLHQDKYRFLENVMSELKEIGYSTFSDNAEVIPVEEALPNSVFLFDDISTEKQHNICDYFSRGRHSNIDSFYLAQTYSKVPKQLVRDNVNLLIIFRQNNRNLMHIYYDHIDPDMTFAEFKIICSKAWNTRHSFLLVNKDCEIDEGRYRYGFDKFITISPNI